MLGKIKTKQEKSGEIIAYSEAAVMNNAAVVEYCRISMAALSGGTAGLLGLTGLYGFGFYIFAVFGLWAMLLMKAGGQWKKYFISRRHLLTSGFFGGLFIFIWDGSCLLRRRTASGSIHIICEYVIPQSRVNMQARQVDPSYLYIT
ncbi:ER membrane protein complex subunit 6 isoform X1 [Ooceraea biroi]|uniref:ER membrane protein complex subunit 6 isoform X1 n=1 Tax=Ooceraea biroi TaxID=2015173 RepID=UPI0005BE50DF|nr:ER membrane protein complex subunit 6 isoform X1 [Ooceraea biroi]